MVNSTCNARACCIAWHSKLFDDSSLRCMLRFKQHVSVVDTSADIVGLASQPHFCLGSSRRFQVLARFGNADEATRRATAASLAVMACHIRQPGVNALQVAWDGKMGEVLQDAARNHAPQVHLS